MSADQTKTENVVVNVTVNTPAAPQDAEAAKKKKQEQAERPQLLTETNPVPWETK